MIAKLRHIVRHATALAVLVLAFASCSSKDNDVAEEPTRDYRLGFYVNVGDNAEASRATPTDGEYNPGSGWENHIDIAGGNIRVVLFNTDDTFLAEISEFNVTPLATYESSKLYFIEATTKADISSGKFKIMIAANWGAYPSEWTFDNIFGQTYTYEPEQPLSATNLIPLYGIKRCDIAGGIKPDIAADLGTVHLLRAMAKVEVQYTPDKIYSIKNVNIRNYNTIGFCAPTGVKNEDEYVHGSWSQDYVPAASIPEDPGHSSGTIELTYDPTSQSWYCYIPEYRNTAISPENPFTYLEITFVDDLKQESTSEIYFGDSGANARDVLRNYWYRFNVRRSDADIKVEVDVLPYLVKELNPDFGLDVPDIIVPTLNLQWKSHQGITDDVRSGNGFGGKVYLVDGTAIRTYDGDKLETVFQNIEPGSLNKGLFVDEAGNMLIKRDWPDGDWSKFFLISADGQTVKDVTVNKPVNSAWTGARSDMSGRAIGDFFSDEGGLCYLTANTQTAPIPLWFRNGEFQQVQNGTSAEFPIANTMAYAQPSVQSMDEVNAGNIANSFYYYTSSSLWNIGYVNDAGTASSKPRPSAAFLPAGWSAQLQNGFDVVVLGGKKYIFRMADTGSWGANFIVHDEEGNVVARSDYNNSAGWGSTGDGNAGWGSGIFVRKVSETKAEVYQIFKGALEASFSAMYIFEVPEP